MCLEFMKKHIIFVIHMKGLENEKDDHLFSSTNCMFRLCIC